MTEMLDTRPKRPVASDMSMDEILSSIRKIISAEETQYNNAVNIQEPVTLPPKEDNPKLKIPLSAREQLKSLTEELYGLQDQEGEEFHLSRPVYTHKNNPVFAETKIDSAKYHSVVETSVKERPAEFPRPIKQNTSQDTADILQTLENIRQSLTHENLRKASTEEEDTTAQISDTQDTTPITKSPLRETYREQSVSEIKNVKLNQEVALRNIDLKPAQLTQDEIPAFLKKFKQEQDAIIKPVTPENPSAVYTERSVPDYDFSKVVAFDEDDSVMELTEALLPENVKKISDNLVETATQSAVSSSAKNKNVASISENDSEDDGVADALEMIMIKSLRPMLKEWIADNMQNLAEKILREELQKRSLKKS